VSNPWVHRVATALMVLSVPACADKAPLVEVERVVVTVPSGGAPALLFLTVRNTGVLPLFLTRAEVEGAGVASVRTETPHRMPSTADASEADASDPMATMSTVDSILIPAGTTLRLAPGGYTGVLEGTTGTLVAGEPRAVTLYFSRAQPVTVQARVAEYAELDALLATEGATDSAPPSIDEGRGLYASDGCAACHGLAGIGDGPVARTLNPPPRDFRTASAFKNGADEGAIAQTLATGIPGGGAMPLYAHLTDRERRSLALYVISLRTTTPSNSGPIP
jgi:copper(I)-binding protein